MSDGGFQHRIRKLLKREREIADTILELSVVSAEREGTDIGMAWETMDAAYHILSGGRWLDDDTAARVERAQEREFAQERAPAARIKP